MYNVGMTANGHLEKKQNKNGENVETLTIDFTNGSLQQLKQLADFFEVGDDNPTEVVKLGISFLQQLKETRESQEESKKQ